jgi:uncharacterized protein (TIGR02246 family)
MPNKDMSIPAEDLAAVREVPVRMIAAWSDNDADAFANLFTEDGVMILPGDVYLKSREEIREFMSAAYSGPYKGTRVTGAPLSAKFLSEDSGVLITRGGVLLGDETDVDPAREIRATWVVAKEEGRWFITSYHNSPVKKD